MKNFLTYGLFTICCITGAHATCTSVTCPTSSSVEILTMPNNCATYTTACLYDNTNKRYIRYYSCNSCNTPATLGEAGTLTDIGLMDICGLTTPSYNTCSCPSTKCLIIQPTTWTSLLGGLERLEQYKCDATTNCEKEAYYEYRCAAGYYGSPKSASDGCTPCPSAPNTWTDAAHTTVAYGTSIPGAATSASDCYLSAGTYYDTTGEFTISTNQACYYSAITPLL